MHFPWFRRLLRIFVAILISLVILGIMIGTVIGCLELKNQLFNRWKDQGIMEQVALIGPSILLAVCMILFGSVYQSLAYYMTNFENHRTA